MNQYPASWWTTERIDELKARWADGESASVIANAMHATSRNAVIGKANRLGLFRSKVTPPKRKRIRKSLRYVDNRFVIVEEPQIMIKEPPPPIFKNPVSFAELADCHCRWPGEPGPQILFCGEPKLNGYSYCPHHCQIAFAKPGARPTVMR